MDFGLCKANCYRYFICIRSFYNTQVPIYMRSSLFALHAVCGDSGAGYYYMRVFERLVRGTWIPTSNEILQPTL